MKRLPACILSLVLIVYACTTTAQSRTIDTLVDVGGYALHFVITEGKGTPILFEAGGGDDASAWKAILPSLSQITSAPLITYDRPGFGKSGVDTINHGINHNIDGLEIALKKLGLDGEMMCVAHSLGGIYAQVFACRHPNLVKTAVMIDATTTCFYQPSRLAATQRSIDQENRKIRYTHPGSYFQGADYSRNMEVARRSPFPATIPVIDFVSDDPPFADSTDIADWKHCHREFVAASDNRKGITAWGCGHFIFADNPPLVILAIARAYAAIVNEDKAKKINENAAGYALQAANEFKKQEMAYRHAEDDINSWGYKLLQAGDIKKAVEVFKLNVFLDSSSWNAYDSYGEALLKIGEKAEALKMYRKSVELNPANQHGKQVLREATSN